MFIAIARTFYYLFDFLSFRPKPVPPLVIDLEKGTQTTDDVFLPYSSL